MASLVSVAFIVKAMSVLREILSERGKILLVLDNFKFSKKDELKSGEVKWCCAIKTCKAQIYTLGEGDGRVISRQQQIHNHEADVSKLCRQMVSAIAKKKAKEEIAIRPSKVVAGVLLDMGEEQALVMQNMTVEDRYCIKRNLYNARRKQYPPLPKSIEDVHSALGALEIQTIEKEDFLLVNDSNVNLVIFSCVTNLRALCKCDSIFLDGTFSHCTKFFLQMFTIHGLNNGHYVPLVFCLINNKKTESYNNCLANVQKECQKLGFILNPRHVTIDFELAIHNSVKANWPDVSIIGCRFHLSQSWWRKIQELGLSSEYKTNSATGKWLKYTFGLQYLPPNEVFECFTSELVELAPPEPDQKLLSYVDYLIDTYISPSATFPPTIWACDSSSSTRTTNNCESFHSHFNSSFYVGKPSLYVFVDTLLGVQIDTYIGLNSTNLPKKSNCSTIKKSKKLDLLLDLYRNKTICRIDYIKQVCHSFSDIMK